MPPMLEYFFAVALDFSACVRPPDAYGGSVMTASNVLGGKLSSTVRLSPWMISHLGLSLMGIRSLRFLFWFLLRFWFGRVLIFLDARNTVLSCYNDGTVNALPHA